MTTQAQTTGFDNITATSGVIPIDMSKGNFKKVTLAGNATFDVSNIPAGQQCYIQVTRTAVAAVVTWAGLAVGITVQFPPLSTSMVMLVGSSDPQTSVAIEGPFTPSSALSGDEVLLASNGTDDTANVTAILAASLVMRAVPPGGTFYIDGTQVSTVLTAADSGGIIGDGEDGVTFRPTTTWDPVVGLANDPTNAYFQVRGQVVSGGWSTTTANILERGSYIIDGLGSTAGMVAGQFGELEITIAAGLAPARETVCIASVDSANQVTVRRPLHMMYGDGYNTLPATFRQINPVRRFFVKNVTFNTATVLNTKNIANAIYFDRCYDAPGTSFGPAASGVRQLYSENVKYVGFTRSLYSWSSVEGMQCERDFSMGANNGYINGCDLSGSHGNSVRGFRANHDGPAWTTNGNVRTMIWLEAGGSDNFFDDNDFTGTAGGLHVVGGWGNVLGEYRGVFGNKPDIRWTRDPGVVAGEKIIGALLDQHIAPSKSEASVGYDYGQGYCGDCYTDGVANPITSGTGVHSFLFCDAFGIFADSLVTMNLGNGSDNIGTTGPVPYWPCGGPTFWDCQFGGSISRIDSRNGGEVGTKNLGWTGGGRIVDYQYNALAGKSTGTQRPAALLLNSTTSDRRTPEIGTLTLVNSDIIATFEGAYVNDYVWRIDRVVNRNAQTTYYDVGLAINAGPVVYFATEVAAMDPAAAAGTRQIIAAGADAASPVIIAQTTNSAKALVAMGGGSCKMQVAGAVTLTDQITTEGGAGHAAKVNNAALAGATNTILGTAKTAKAAAVAGTLVVRR